MFLLMSPGIANIRVGQFALNLDLLSEQKKKQKKKF